MSHNAKAWNLNVLHLIHVNFVELKCCKTSSSRSGGLSDKTKTSK